MIKTILRVAMLSMVILSAQGGITYSQDGAPAQEQENIPQEAQPAPEPPAPDYTLDFQGAIARISGSPTPEDLVKAVDEISAQCKTYDDFEKLVSDIKGMSQDLSSKDPGAPHYAIAKLRQAQLALLSKDNDLEAGRLYMNVNGQYFTEALDSLDKALVAARSKALVADIRFLRFQIYKEKIQPQQAEDEFNALVSAIIDRSEDAAGRLAALNAVSEKFKAAGLNDYAIRIKTAFASKADSATAKEIFESLRSDADMLFSQGSHQDAQAMYDQYTSLAQNYFTKDELAPKIMEIAEKYFQSGKYKEARHYYEHYMQNFDDSKVVDYASYRLAACFYNEHDYTKAITQLENFVTAYQASIWYDKAFELLSKLYYENFQKEKAIEGLQHLIDAYYRKNVGDYAQVLIALLHYHDKEYDKASARLKKVDPASSYYYSAEILTEDIKKIKRGAKPSFGIRSDNSFRMWDPSKSADGELLPAEFAGKKQGGVSKKSDRRPEIARNEEGLPMMEARPGSSVKIAITALEDSDSYSAYMQDKDDASRLPKKLSEQTEKDLISVQWTSGGGKFADEKQTQTKEWQAPNEPGAYKVVARVDDFGLVRQPDKGIRKDPAKELGLVVIVRE